MSGPQEKRLLIVKTGSIVERLPSVAAAFGDLDAIFARALGLPPERLYVVAVHAGEVLSDPPDAFGGVLVTGSPAMVSAREPWMEATADWLRGAVLSGVPVLGVCFGHQLLAHALGGTVGPNPKGPEAGTVEVAFAYEGRADPLFADLPARAKFNAHHYESVLALPPGATVLAESALEAYQAVRYSEKAWGVQFHPEFGAAFMHALVDALGESLATTGIDVNALRAAIGEAPAGLPLLRRFLALTGVGADDPVVFHPGVGQDVRIGSWDEQCRSTYDMATDAVRQGRRYEAARLARYSVTEAQEAFELFTQWRERTRLYLLESGVEERMVTAEETALVARVTEGRTGPFEPEREWRDIGVLAEEAAGLCMAGEAEAAVPAIEAVRLAWLDLHDRLCDWTQGMVGLVAHHLGEERIGALWQMLMADMSAGYERYNIDHTPWKRSAEALLYIAAEALRGHLSGPGRRGAVELVREKDRIGFRFAPCGSGGRNVTGETYGRYPVTTEPHDWAWNLKGVCLYCAHCCVLSEVNPIQRLGYPAREVEPPYENGKDRRLYCTWWVYNDPSLVPDEVYGRTGHRKPSHMMKE